jgi:acetyl-CoA carboxylase alpha subunit
MYVNIYLWIIGSLLGLVNFLFWSRIKRIEKDVDETKKKTSTIEKNYLTRFEELHSKLSDVEKNIIREIYNVKLTTIANKPARDKKTKSYEL